MRPALSRRLEAEGLSGELADASVEALLHELHRQVKRHPLTLRPASGIEPQVPSPPLGGAPVACVAGRRTPLTRHPSAPIR